MGILYKKKNDPTTFKLKKRNICADYLKYRFLHKIICSQKTNEIQYKSFLYMEQKMGQICANIVYRLKIIFFSYIFIIKLQSETILFCQLVRFQKKKKTICVLCYTLLHYTNVTLASGFSDFM